MSDLTISDYEEVLADKRRLARELDIALHGVDHAAKQASLCDLIGPAKRAKRAVDIVTLLANTPPQDWRSKPEIHAALSEFRESNNRTLTGQVSAKFDALS